MSSLMTNFDEVMARIRYGRDLGPASFEPIYYLVFPPKQILEDQVEEMLAIVRRHSGKQHVLFVVNEVGQYVSERKHLILNLQGLAENLKNVGDGKAWIMATAQQTLTEDDPRAALNSPELYKLKDRFPIQIDLESSDIKEICTRRLLGKSTDGEQALGDLFDKHGPALRYSTRLQDAR